MIKDFDLVSTVRTSNCTTYDIFVFPTCFQFLFKCRNKQCRDVQRKLIETILYYHVCVPKRLIAIVIILSFLFTFVIRTVNKRYTLMVCML